MEIKKRKQQRKKEENDDNDKEGTNPSIVIEDPVVVTISTVATKKHTGTMNWLKELDTCIK